MNPTVRQTGTLLGDLAAGLLLLLILSLQSQPSQGQALATATGPGRYLGVGGTVSIYQAQYGRQVLGGTSVFFDANPTWRLGFEGEGRTLQLHSQESVSESTLLAGPRLSLRSQGVVPYVKFLAGGGRLNFPFHYAQGDYFVLAPGAGIDYRWRGRLTVRLIDFEYQDWPQFSFGAFHPYGFSAGLSVRLFEGPDYPGRSSRRLR